MPIQGSRGRAVPALSPSVELQQRARLVIADRRGLALLPEQPDADAPKVDGQAVHLAAMSSPTLKETDLSGVKILVVDDEADARQLVKNILEECNARVTVAASAEHALVLLKEEAPHVLVSDIGMPDMDGFELIRQVRKLGQDVAGIPAIALTAFARAQDQEQALQAGFCRYLSKPVEATDLASMIATLTQSFPGAEPYF